MAAVVRSSLHRVAAGVCAAALVGAMVAGCGANEERVALSIVDTEWADDSHLVIYTECAELDDVEIDRTGELVEVSLWGAPKFGRCRDRMVLSVEPGTTKITDAATSQVVDLPAYVPDPDGASHHGG
jgi:hypothetical protein